MRFSPKTRYPFAAIVGQDRLRAALLANAVDPGIGGVLIRGQKGTGKSTAARGLAAVLPPLTMVSGCPYHCDPTDAEGRCGDCDATLRRGAELPSETALMPVVELPLNATEDRVAGTLHIEETLRTGLRRFEPGLLAAANRGILYIDEVNLLEDHLVDLLLDAAASGVNTVEREGMSVSHPSRFIPVGTMNPEEGELRPQFLDRFGLCVSVDTLRDPDERGEVVRRRLAFERDADGFRREWADDQARIAGSVLAARELLRRVPIDTESVDLAVRMASAAGAKGHRADLAILKTARALAALCGRDAMTRADLAEAARLALPHRAEAGFRGIADDMADRVEGVVRDVLGDASGSGGAGGGAASVADDDHLDEMMQVPGNFAAAGMPFPFLKKKR